MNSSIPLETQHASLKRKKEPSAPPPVLYSPILERAEVRSISLVVFENVSCWWRKVNVNTLFAFYQVLLQQFAVQQNAIAGLKRSGLRNVDHKSSCL